MLMQLSSVTLTMSKRTDSLGFEDVSGHACEESGELAQTDERANVRTGAGGPSNRASKQPMEKWTPGERGAARRRGGRGHSYLGLRKVGPARSCEEGGRGRVV